MIVDRGVFIGPAVATLELPAFFFLASGLRRFRHFAAQAVCVRKTKQKNYCHRHRVEWPGLACYEMLYEIYFVFGLKSNRPCVIC